MSRINTSLITKRRKGISLVPALFVLIVLFLFSENIRAETPDVLDSARTTDASAQKKAALPDTGKYDLNDPRNPDCPCHKAQKLADDEYRNSQVQQGNKNPVNNDPVHVNEDVNRGNNSNVNRGNNSDVNRGNPADNVNANADINTNQTSYTGGSSGSQKHYSKFYKFSKKMKRWTKKMNRKLKSKNKGTKGGKFRVADCFHWM
jgi:hypothetical protein